MGVEVRPQLGISTVFVSLSTIFATAPYGMAYLPWTFDGAVFEGPAVACFLLGALVSVIGAVLTLGRVELIPDWQWRCEVGAAAVSGALLVNLFRLW
jgi:hypothetical protein